MRRPGGNHLDRHRLLLQPRAYAVVPQAFGSDLHARFVIPADGDQISARVAFIQHQLVCRYRNGPYPSGTELGRSFGFSSSTWSRTMLGDRWAGTLLFAAMLDPIVTTIERRPTSS